MTLLNSIIGYLLSSSAKWLIDQENKGNYYLQLKTQHSKVLPLVFTFLPEQFSLDNVHNRLSISIDHLEMAFTGKKKGIQHPPTTEGSRSTKIALGTFLPEPLSLKKVLCDSEVDSTSVLPSGWMPCSRQYNSQQELPICTPAWPIWRLNTSLCKEKAIKCCGQNKKGKKLCEWFIKDHDD